MSYGGGGVKIVKFFYIGVDMIIYKGQILSDVMISVPPSSFVGGYGDRSPIMILSAEIPKVREKGGKEK